MQTRKEHDCLGERALAQDAYYGIHTQRAIENFSVSGYPVSPDLIIAIAQVKKACALTNGELGFLAAEKAQAIAAACDDVCRGELTDAFPLDAMQGGAGTSTNMNVNEVIANRALELLGCRRADYGVIHPIQHVNLHQSTNDVYPTALKIAIIGKLRALSAAVEDIQGVFQKKEKEFHDIVTMGRTEMQAAVPMTLGGIFSGFAGAFARDRWRTFKCEERIRTVNLGGTAVGTGLCAPKRYIFLVIEKLRDVTGLGLARAENLVDNTMNMDPLVEISGILKAHATNVMKVCRDLRMMHMLDEITVPAVQAGSSIMPGKINPVVLECGIQTALKVMHNDGLVAMACAEGTLQINEYLPLISFTMLESLDLLIRLNALLAKHCGDIVGNRAQCACSTAQSETLVTACIPKIGYEKAEEYVAEFRVSGRKDMRAFLSEKLGEETVGEMLHPSNVTKLGY